MTQYKLAIVIPSWNCSEYIGEMLDSILENSFQDYRVYIVDDLSSDNSAQVIESYCEKDDRIRLIKRNRTPKGAQTCRNIGFELSKDAEYIIWFDADDVVAPYSFQQRVSYMDSHPDLDFGVFPAKTFVHDIWDDIVVHNSYGVCFGNDSLKAMLNRTIPMVGWTNIYRVSSLLHNDIHWDERLLSMQDSDFNITCLIKGLKHDYAYDNGAKADYFYRYIVNGESNIASKIGSKKHFGSHVVLLNKILQSLSDIQIKKYENDLKCYVFLFAIIFAYDKETYNEFLKIPFIKKRLSLFIGLYFYQFIKGHVRLAALLMLSKVPLDVIKRQREWEIFMAKNKKLMIEKKDS